MSIKTVSAKLKRDQPTVGQNMKYQVQLDYAYSDVAGHRQD